MAYDSTAVVNDGAYLFGKKSAYFAPGRIDDDFRRGERVVVVAGASVLGALCGVAGAISIGRVDTWMTLAAGAPLYILAIHFAAATLHDAIARKAYGCATATFVHMSALFAWPVAALFYAYSTLHFWIAPATALSALLLFASCWGGAQRVVYRTCAQGALMTVCASYVGFLTAMGA